MSTGDFLRFQRALKGGPTPVEIQEATGVSSGTYRQLEQRYRVMGTEEELDKLAEYFGVDKQELLDRQEWSRKRLSADLVEASEQDRPVRLTLRTGEVLAGRVRWSDLGAALVELEDGRKLVVQRHVIDRWELV